MKHRRSRRPRLRALVLAAGFGTRLRPLTAFLPKPLLPVCGEPVAGYTLRRLAGAGCEAAALNLHHLAERLPESIGRSYFGLPLVYSREAEIQGTLGALHPLRAFLGSADVILMVNGDSLCRWPIEKLVRHHLRRGAEATMLVHAAAPTGVFGGGVGLDARGRVVQLRDAEPAGEVARRRVFTGAHALSPRLLERIAEGQADVVTDLYLPLLAEGGRIEALVTRRPWYDLGSPGRYLEAVTREARGGWPARLWRGTAIVSPLAEVAADASVETSAIEARAVVEPGARIEGSAVLEGAVIGSGASVSRCIVGPGVEVPAAASIEGRMINRVPGSYRPAAQESVLGGLIYTPL